MSLGLLLLFLNKGKLLQSKKALPAELLSTTLFQCMWLYGAEGKKVTPRAARADAISVSIFTTLVRKSHKLLLIKNQQLKISEERSTTLNFAGKNSRMYCSVSDKRPHYPICG